MCWPGTKVAAILSLSNIVAILSRAGLSSNRNFDPDLLREKVRTLLYMAVQSNCDALVLGALGCGAFLNPPEAVARAFWELLVPEEAEFHQRFATVEFAIIKSSENLSAFRRQFNQAPL